MKPTKPINHHAFLYETSWSTKSPPPSCSTTRQTPRSDYSKSYQTSKGREWASYWPPPTECDGSAIGRLSPQNLSIPAPRAAIGFRKLCPGMAPNDCRYNQPLMAGMNELSPKDHLLLKHFHAKVEEETYRRQDHEDRKIAGHIQGEISLKYQEAEPCACADELADDRSRHAQQ
jgi:hypothetical protein